MATLVMKDECENHIKSVTEQQDQSAVESSPPTALTVPNPSPESKPDESISMRRDRSLTAFLFEEIVGKKLKCYEQWKLWLGLFIGMTVIAIIAIVLATTYAVKYNSYKSKAEAVNVESKLLYDIVHDETANYTDHLDEAHKIFNTFDDNQDGVWNAHEYYHHFALASSAQFVFDAIDENDDDILSFTEIAASIPKYSLAESYIPSVHQMYNYTFANASDPLLAKYAANVYLQSYHVEEFGFMTRSYYYEFRSNVSFTRFDIDHDNLISFDEFSQKVGNDEFISFLRKWDIESYLVTLDQSGKDSAPTVVTPTDITNMCPYQESNAYGGRRLVDTINEDDVEFDKGGFLHYQYDNDGCIADLWCGTIYLDGKAAYVGMTSHGIAVEDNCPRNEIDHMVHCMVIAINEYISGNLAVNDCWDKMLTCFDWDVFDKDPGLRWESDGCFPFCTCSCSEECEGKLVDSSRRRLGKDCGKDKCACGGGCTCFSGDNEMWIKRDDIIQNVLLKELKIGDYAQTKEGEWSKVWFIKEEESSEYEFLKLYFAEDEYITMTSHHLLYVDERTEQSMKRADRVNIGDTVFVMRNATFFVQKEIVSIESTISADGAYAPVTMDGSIVVSNVLSSCYIESPQKAQRLHDTAAIFRWISSYNTDLGSFMCHFFYDSFFLKLRNDYGLDAAHIVFNPYSMPCIVVATLNIAVFGFIRSFSYCF